MALTPAVMTGGSDLVSLPTSVQALETNGVPCETILDRSEHPLRVQSRAQKRVHAPFRRDRSRIISALWRSSSDDHGRRALRLGRCSQLPTIRQKADGSIRADLARCRDRLCPLCGDLRGRVCQSRVEKCVTKADFLRFATLTLADDGKGLAERADRIFDSFRRLRQTPEWRRWVRGAVATIEVTLGGNVRHWHVHLHFVWDGEYIPHAVIKRLWRQITGDSYIVDLKAIRGKRAAVHYITAYIAKPMAVQGWTDEEVQEYASAMHGRRLLSTSGSFHNPESDDDTEPDVPPPSVHLVAVHALESAETRGSEHARHAADILSRMSPNLAIILDRPVAPKNTCLPPVDPREVKFAIDVCQEIEWRFPKVPDPAVLERLRRLAFGEPDPPPPFRERQTTTQDQSGW